MGSLPRDRRPGCGASLPCASMLRRTLTACLTLLAAALGMGIASGAQAAAEPAGVVDVPVAFAVKNTNTSRVSCASDGAPYTVRGHLIAPAAQLAGSGPQAVTLYLHGLGYGEFFWHFTGVPGYDFATELARAGNASLVIDRLGYGASGKPPGQQSCYGSQADVTHQLVGQLRAGSYQAGGAAARAFSRVVLASHSAEGFAAQNEAYTYRDVDGLMVFSFADSGSTPLTLSLFGRTQMICAAGGQPQAGSSGPGGYAYVGQSDAEFQGANFYDTDPAVVSLVTGMRSRDPCGETASAVASGMSDSVNDGQITAPVLLAIGDHDVLFSPSSLSTQKAQFTGSRDVTALTLPDTGQAVTLGRSAPAFRSVVIDWLRAHGFSGAPPSSTSTAPPTTSGALPPSGGGSPGTHARTHLRHCVRRHRHHSGGRYCHPDRRGRHTRHRARHGHHRQAVAHRPRR